MKRFWLGLLILGLTAACATIATTAEPPPPAASAPAATTPSAPAAASPRTAPQGAGEFAVTPLNLGANAATLDFAVVMDTHSVDLSWDLAKQAALETDTGLRVTGSQWTAGSGHHYENTLVFPAQTTDGTPLLAAAKTLTLIIQNTDVPERTFVWEIRP